ncbi:hypothetical protein [Brucella intermedia]|uniref:hypothetical protein n=1 Tax=Brucella intermedia TaxID=94625 RepID=UPI00235EE7B8|nr:hypothetical protein [Brucella intermedia]
MTRFNKFWAAAVMAVVAFIRSYFGIDLGVDDATANAIVAAVTALLVWFIPNREQKPKGND